ASTRWRSRWSGPPSRSRRCCRSRRCWDGSMRFASWWERCERYFVARQGMSFDRKAGFRGGSGGDSCLAILNGRCRFADKARGRLDHGRQLRHRDRFGEQETLTLGAAFARQKIPLRFGLDAFGENRHVQAFAKREHGADNGGSRGVVRQPFDEGLVELDLVERKYVQRRQRRIA